MGNEIRDMAAKLLWIMGHQTEKIDGALLPFIKEVYKEYSEEQQLVIFAAIKRNMRS